MEKLGFMYAFIAAMTWGLAYAIDQKILEDASPALLLFFNAVLTLFVISPIVLMNGDLKESFNFKGDVVYLIIITQLLTLAGTFFILSAIKILGASQASVFEITYPFFVIIFSYFIFGTSFNIFFWIGSSLLFLGSLILIRFS